jgi:uncharacterized protein (TIGR03435 family)
MRIVFILAALAVNLAGQQFEVVSVRPSAPDDGGPRGVDEATGGPGTGNPTRFRATNMSISGLVMRAYGVRRFQVIGPDWLTTTRFEVNAKVPAGATREQFRLMLQGFLTERFGMVTHRETRESQVFELVQAKSGHKLKEYVEESASPPAAIRQNSVRRVGPPGATTVFAGGAAEHMESRGVPVDGLVTTLSNLLGKPVHNATGLTGKYNFKLDYSRDGLPGRAQPPPGSGGGESAPNLFTALEEQLGLKLEQKKGTIEVLVVDKALKTPTAN